MPLFNPACGSPLAARTPQYLFIMDILKHSVYLLLLTLCVAACRGCDGTDCDDPTWKACSNYDPCHGKDKLVSAAFDVLLDLQGGEGIFPVGDTVGTYLPLRFVARDSTLDTTYAWEVGNPQNASNSRFYNLSFPCENVLGQTIPIKLVAARVGDSTCLAGRPLRDTMVRYIHFVDPTEGHSWGRWEGALDGTGGTRFTIEVSRTYTPPGANNPCGEISDVFLHNLLNDGCRMLALRRISLYDRLFLGEAYDPALPRICLPPTGFHGFALRDVDITHPGGRDSITIHFRHRMFSLQGDREDKLVFRGRRVQ